MARQCMTMRRKELFYRVGAIVIPILYMPVAGKQNSLIKIKGLSYAEIAAKGGGILNSAKKLSEATARSIIH